jgi:hypothetical protein
VPVRYAPPPPGGASRHRILYRDRIPGEPLLRRSLLATLTLALVLPATAMAAAEEEHGTEENVTAVMMILIGALIALGLIIVAIESKRSK